MKLVFVANSVDLDEMPHYFIWIFTVCQSSHLVVTNIQRI